MCGEIVKHETAQQLLVSLNTDRDRVIASPLCRCLCAHARPRRWNQMRAASISLAMVFSFSMSTIDQYVLVHRIGNGIDGTVLITYMFSAKA